MSVTGTGEGGSTSDRRWSPSMTEQWPVPGHRFWYKANIRLENGYELHFDLSLPGALSSFDLSTLRLGRHGGMTNADRLFRARLNARIGAVTVAGGHVETAMKRLLLLLREESGGFLQVDMTWTDLHKALAAECETPDLDQRGTRLARVLAWDDDKQVKRRRDNVVHAYWWSFDGCGVVRSRFHRRQNGQTMIGSMEELEEDAELLFEYADRLDDLLGEDWPRAMLPGPQAAQEE
jgi:hypothetical protein